MKFEATYYKVNVVQNSSALSFLNSNKRGKIKVQRAAVAKRVNKKGRFQKQDNSHRNKLELPKRRIIIKRQHNISKIVGTNEPAAKKSGRTVVSVTTYPKEKNPLTVDYEKNEK